MPKYVVTGGAGFIGSNIAEALVRLGREVVVFDNFSTGKRGNLAHIEDGLTIVEGSVTSLDDCRKAVEGADYVFHEAALASVPRSVAEPLASNETNITGTLNMLIAARDAGVRRLVYAGSSSAYGNNPQMPKVEDMATAPLSPYAISKLAGEMYCQVFHDLYGLETVVLRYFNVFGPRQDPASEYAAVIPRFITRALRGESFTIYGDGGQSRDFTYVDNVVRANLLACEAPSAAAGQVINAACGDSISLNELAGLIMEITGNAAPIQYEEARAGDVRHSHADISRAKSLLDYEPAVSFREGLEKVIAWYKADMGL